MDEIPRMEEFCVSETHGFLVINPLANLPPYFKPWHDVADNFPELIKKKTLRDAVEKMPLLDHCKLRGYREHHRAYCILTFIGSGYVWQNGVDDPPARLPRQVAIPWYSVSKYLGLKPAMGHAANVLGNWRAIDPNSPLTFENLEPITYFDHEGHSKVFVNGTVLVELAAGKGLKGVIDALHGIQQNDPDMVAEGLNKLAESFADMLTALNQVNDLSVPGFHDHIRRFLLGWGQGSKLEDGLIFEGVSETPVMVGGGSAGHSSTMVLFDTALGIEHKKDHTVKFFESMLSHMPYLHREFILAVKRAPSIKTYVTETTDSVAVKDAYKRCINGSVAFRTRHIQAVTRYVIIHTRKTDTSVKTVSEHEEVLGTTGAPLMPLLKSVRDTAKSMLQYME